jgi:hypothetical protein
VEQAVTTEQAIDKAQSIERPYPPSWVDRVTDWVRGLPIPAWLFYLMLGVASALLETIVKWIDGTYPVGTFYLYHLMNGISGPYALGLIHYLDDSATNALVTFRPVMRADEAEYKRLRYQLTTLPRWPTFIVSVVSAAAAMVTMLSSGPDQSHVQKMLTSPEATVVDLTIFMTQLAVLSALIYHTVRQLRMVNHIYSYQTHINLFQSLPLYAFSKLTARTAIGLALPSYIWYLIQSESEGDVSAVVANILLLILAAATFVLPLLGIHRLLQAEKEHLQSEAAQRVEAVVKELHHRTDTGDFTHMAGLKDAMEGLVNEQNVIEKIRTWPWEPGTVRGLATALLLPVIIWVITKLLERFSGF